MKFCNKCGSKIQLNANFCNKCGNSLNKNLLENINEDPVLVDNNLVDNSTENNNFEQTITDVTSNENTIVIKDKSKTLFISCSVSLAILIFFIFISNEELFYKYHYNKGVNITEIASKLTHFNNALAYKYDNEIINSIYDSLKDDPDFIRKINNMSNLEILDKSELIKKISVFKAESYFTEGNYEDSLKLLETAAKYGYDLDKCVYYEKLLQKIEDKNSTSSNYDSYNTKDEFNSKYSDDYIEPYSDSKYLTYSSLSKHDKDTLALIRNEIFARHGYIFKTNPFKDYFNSKPWYSPSYSFKGNEDELNDYELENIKLIKELENR